MLPSPVDHTDIVLLTSLASLAALPPYSSRHPLLTTGYSCRGSMQVACKFFLVPVSPEPLLQPHPQVCNRTNEATVLPPLCISYGSQSPSCPNLLLSSSCFISGLNFNRHSLLTYRLPTKRAGRLSVDLLISLCSSGSATQSHIQPDQLG